MHISDFIYDLINPLLVAVMSMPIVIFAPLFIIWFGIGDLSKIIFAFINAVIPICLNVTSGLKSINPGIAEASAAIGFTKWQSVYLIELPCSQPSLFIGLKIGLSKGIAATIIGEMLASREGLGWIINVYSGMFRADVIFLCIIIIFSISFLLCKTIDFVFYIQTNKWLEQNSNKNH